ncbi:hypothetical protein GCM10027614_03960 [Micromonospora vulcania]
MGWPGKGALIPLTGLVASWVPEIGPGWYAVADSSARSFSVTSDRSRTDSE